MVITYCLFAQPCLSSRTRGVLMAMLRV